MKRRRSSNGLQDSETGKKDGLAEKGNLKMTFRDSHDRSKLREQKKEAASSFCPSAPVQSILVANREECSADRSPRITVGYGDHDPARGQARKL